jgi:hypothetical protein
MDNERFVPQIQVRSDLCSGYGWNPGGGYVNGVWYPDRSGVCGGVVPPYPPVPPNPPVPPSPTGGGYVNGVWYPDRSGVCG